jgi:hypothetical protein
MAVYPVTKGSFKVVIKIPALRNPVYLKET